MLTYEQITELSNTMEHSYLNQESFLKASKILKKHWNILMFIILSVLEDGSFHIKEIEKLSWLKRTQFYIVKKKLIDNGMILYKDWIYYLNPIFSWRWANNLILSEYFSQFTNLF